MKSPKSPYNSQNGGHSDLRREKLVYSSFYLVHGDALEVSMVTKWNKVYIPVFHAGGDCGLRWGHFMDFLAISWKSLKTKEIGTSRFYSRTKKSDFFEKRQNFDLNQCIGMFRLCWCRFRPPNQPKTSPKPDFDQFSKKSDFLKNRENRRVGGAGRRPIKWVPRTRVKEVSPVT